MKNAKGVIFRPPWVPTRKENLGAFRKDYDLRNPRPAPNARGYDADWRSLRAEVLAAEPYCRECTRRGIERRAQMVDHIEPIRSAPERRLDRSNLQPLCWNCHRVKSNRVDGGFGRQRGGAFQKSSQVPGTGPAKRFFMDS